MGQDRTRRRGPRKPGTQGRRQLGERPASTITGTASIPAASRLRAETRCVQRAHAHSTAVAPSPAAELLAARCSLLGDDMASSGSPRGQSSRGSGLAHGGGGATNSTDRPEPSVRGGRTRPAAGAEHQVRRSARSQQIQHDSVTSRMAPAPAARRWPRPEGPGRQTALQHHVITCLIPAPGDGPTRSSARAPQTVRARSAAESMTVLKLIFSLARVRVTTPAGGRRRLAGTGRSRVATLAAAPSTLPRRHQTPGAHAGPSAVRPREAAAS